jgi:hypothetical protein
MRMRVCVRAHTHASTVFAHICVCVCVRTHTHTHTGVGSKLHKDIVEREKKRYSRSAPYPKLNKNTTPYCTKPQTKKPCYSCPPFQHPFLSHTLPTRYVLDIG